ncbi:phage portal protein [Streptomyces sp. NPDC088915]|uniref:phage portal protein n=1 Tax=Streptomyces sp. NPDC088915 TaxID=3365912 RepID=UPI0038011C8F
MGRRWLPALRSLVTPGPKPAESKTVTWTGGYTSTTHATATTSWGTEGRADGWDLNKVVTEGFEQSIWTFKAIDTMGKHASRLPLEIGRGLTEDGEFEETFPDHPLLRVLNGQANPLETGPVLRKRASGQILLSKRGAFIEVTRSNRGTITRLDLLPPDRVIPVPDPKGEYIKHYEFTTLYGDVRELDPERVRWIRDPHPTDPFSGITPLEAAGISVDLDHLSRLYNVAFIRNDARPGGVLAVDTSTMSARDMDRLEHRFLPGAEYAGHLSVIGSGPGGMNYVDLAARPREMAYEHASQNAKVEILAAFGVPESVTGNASGRTFDNAEQEEYGFWVHTELPHLELIANAFASDLGDDLSIRYDTSTVEALELPRRKRRAEAREEWEAGLISIDEYRKRSGFPAYDNAHSRALWISPQKAPVPQHPADAAALGIAGPGQQPGAEDPLAGHPAPTGEPPALDPGAEPDGAAAQAVAQARAEGAAPAGPGPAAAAVEQARVQDAPPGSGAAAAAVAEAREHDEPEPGLAAAAVDEARGIQTKGLPTSGPREHVVTDDDFDRARLATAAALDALFARQQGVILARLRSPKARKKTRFWAADGPHDTRGGTTPLDTARIVDAERWTDEAADTFTPILTQAAAAVARDIAAAFGADLPPAAAQGGIATAVLAAVAAATSTLHDFLEGLAGLLDQAQGVTDDLEDLASLIRTVFADRAADVARHVAEAAATATVNGAAEATAAALGPGVERTWITRRDDRVRPAHEAQDGVTLPVTEPYDVAGYPMRYPGDPIAPIALTANCRCRLYYRSTNTEEKSP